MKKLFFLLAIFLLFTSSTFAISLDELRNSPEQFKHVYTDETFETYVSVPSINVTNYNPPYYSINATVYAVEHEANRIIKSDMTFFYDYNRSSEMLKKKFSNSALIINEQKKNSGVQSKMNSINVYHLDGSVQNFSRPDNSFFSNKVTLLIPSAAYTAAVYSFYKSYNMYFNSPSNNQLF
ncbi:hypothetical protein [Veillonella sp. CHU740]|uniref:hypothetical protein n=1 Tax=Veillonella sp. CHU740 TaxID=2490950 RepID=UPI000F8E6849|nr:hypothetical protein [Veillonella sp. CHU740]